MICSRCAHWNNEDEHRCTKCAARLNDRQVESAFHSRGALALQTELAAAPGGVAVGVFEEPARLALEVRNEFEDLQTRIPKYVTSLQQSLFSLRESAKVVSIDGLEGQEPERRPLKKSVPSKRRAVTASYLPEQGVLEFVPMSLPQPRKLATSVDAKIYCSHPVASVTHRLFAAVYDLGLISVLLLTFLGILYWGCDDLSWALADPMSATVLGAGAVLIGLIYNSVFLAVRGETPGMQFAGLRLVDFDGRPSTEAQLHMRILGAFFSVLPAGMGLLWALVDEESLTWQDHISHTFPTPMAGE
jgi:uncharacterized RDD family membrane protein YckC